jgi:hypothetical protein
MRDHAAFPSAVREYHLLFVLYIINIHFPNLAAVFSHNVGIYQLNCAKWPFRMPTLNFISGCAVCNP